MGSPWLTTQTNVSSPSIGSLTCLQNMADSGPYPLLLVLTSSPSLIPRSFHCIRFPHFFPSASQFQLFPHSLPLSHPWNLILLTPVPTYTQSTHKTYSISPSQRFHVSSVEYSILPNFSGFVDCSLSIIYLTSKIHLQGNTYLICLSDDFFVFHPFACNFHDFLFLFLFELANVLYIIYLIL